MKPNLFPSRRWRPEAVAFKITLCYLLLGILWILVSDRVASHLAPSMEAFSAVQTYKGWVFVLVSGCLLFLLVRHFSRKLLREEKTIEKLAFFDPLTALPNRQFFRERVERILADNEVGNRQLAVLFLDLDRFKPVVLTFGHSVGDRILQEAAGRLRGCLRTEDLLAHTCSDEFLALMPVENSREVREMGEAILASLKTPFLCEGHEVHLSASIGASLYPQDGQDAEKLMKRAEVAMGRVKVMGKNGFQFYLPEHDNRSLHQLTLESRLHRALERQELSLFFQPQQDLERGGCVGTEALVSWASSPWGRISAAEFIPLAEETGLIGPIGEWILLGACERIKAWRDEGLSTGRVSVNLSARQFFQQDIAELVAKVLARTGLNGEVLALEITESVMMRDIDRARSHLNRLKRMGVEVVLDDFGTGYSSLSYLKQLPVDVLKLDQSFIRDIPGNREDASITRAVLSMARALGLTVVAEGVERAEQRDFLAAEGCDRIQGFYYSPPLPAEECAAFFRQRAEGVGRRR